MTSISKCRGPASSVESPEAARPLKVRPNRRASLARSTTPAAPRSCEERLMSDLVLGVDCSTTASKVIAWNRHGKALGEGRASLPEIRPLPLYSEQAAEAWWEATAEALARLTKSITSDRIVGLCITHQRE